MIVARNSKDTKALTKDLQDAQLAGRGRRDQVQPRGPAQRVTDLSGERIFVLWRSYGNRSATERQKVIAHEMVHAALAKRTSGRTPPWLYEGIAMYASGDDRSGDAGALISGRGVLATAPSRGAAKAAMSLTKLSNPRALQKHVAGVADVRLLVLVRGRLRDRRKHGDKALLRLLTAFNSEKVAASPGASSATGSSARCSRSR